MAAIWFTVVSAKVFGSTAPDSRRAYRHLSTAAITAVLVSPYFDATNAINVLILAAGFKKLGPYKIASNSMHLIASTKTSMFLSSIACMRTLNIY